MRSDLEYFRRHIRDAVGDWVADQVRGGKTPAPLAALMMERARDYLLSRVDSIEDPQHGETAAKAEAAGRADYDRATRGG